MITRIGSRADAARAHEVSRSEDWMMDPDFEAIGSGASRVAWLHHPTNVIYKTADRYWSQGMNAAEVRRARTLAKIIENNGRVRNLRAPKASLYNIDGNEVVAMERVIGEVLPYTDSERALRGRAELYLLGKFDDMHNENYLVEDGDVVVPIDLGSTRYFSDQRLVWGIPQWYIETVRLSLMG